MQLVKMLTAASINRIKGEMICEKNFLKTEKKSEFLSLKFIIINPTGRARKKS